MKTVKAWAILNSSGNLWSMRLEDTKEKAEQRLKEICYNNIYDFEMKDFSIVPCDLIYENVVII